MFRFCQRARQRPSFKPSPKGCVGYSEFTCPVLEDHSFPIKSYPMIVSFVPCLLFRGGPAAVFGGVWPSIVLTFKRVMRSGTLAHVLEKCFERVFPVVTDKDTPPTVVCKSSSVRVFASLLHQLPDCVFGEVPFSVYCKPLAIDLTLQTATGFGVSADKCCRGNERGVSTIALTKPADIRASICPSFEDNKATKSMVRDIFESRHRNLFTRLWCLGGQGRQPLSAAYYSTAGF